MPCHHLKLPDGTSYIVCGRGGRSMRCVTCGRPATLLCDYPVMRLGEAGTCDKPVCVRCLIAQGPEKDYCLAHADLAGKLPQQGGLF